MTTTRHLFTPSGALLAMIATFGAAHSASAQQPTLNTSGLTPAQCYQKDSDCTQFCGDVVGDLRYECFAICDRMLNRCLDTGDWTDHLTADPGDGGGGWPGWGAGEFGNLSSLLLNLLMSASDTDGDGWVPFTEIQALKEKVHKKEDVGGETKDPIEPTKPIATEIFLR